MLCKDGHSNWNPDMIYFSNTTVRPTPAYYVQKLFSTNSGDRYVYSKLQVSNPDWQHRIGASVVRDSKTGRIYVKLVNALPCELTINIQGLDIPATARTEGFSGKPEDQKLTIETGEAGNQIALPPYSMKVIEL